MHEGIVQNGVVVFGPGFTLPEGTHVHIQPVAPPAEPAEKDAPSLDWLLKLAGTANDLPIDMAENHDHYLHGAPKR